jgi:hypothetical protein
MKKQFKKIAIITLSIIAFSCSKEDDMSQPPLDPFIENINAERFTGVELGYGGLVPLEGSMHMNFSYQGDEKVSKVYVDIEPQKEMILKKNQHILLYKKHLLKDKRYTGVKNLGVHKHLNLNKDKDGNYNGAKKSWTSSAAPGTYKFKITVLDEKGEKSAITETIKIVQSYSDIKIANQKVNPIILDKIRIKQGAKSIPLELTYDGGEREVQQITFKLIPPNNTGKEVEKSLELKKYLKGKNIYSIKYDFLIDSKLPRGTYNFSVSVGSSGETTSFDNIIIIE